GVASATVGVAAAAWVAAGAGSGAVAAGWAADGADLVGAAGVECPSLGTTTIAPMTSTAAMAAPIPIILPLPASMLAPNPMRGCFRTGSSSTSETGGGVGVRATTAGIGGGVGFETN